MLTTENKGRETLRKKRKSNANEQKPNKTLVADAKNKVVESLMMSSYSIQTVDAGDLLNQHVTTGFVFFCVRNRWTNNLARPLYGDSSPSYEEMVA